MAQINTNLSDYEVQDAFETLTPGWYEAVVDNSEVCVAKSSGNQYIKWTFSIEGKPNKIWTNTMLNNDVSMRILKTMATCCGHKNPNYIADTEELHGKKCQIKVAVDVDKNGDYEPKNVIKGFKPSTQVSASTAKFTAASVTEQTKSVQMPWES